jgi:hypothetical protein
VIKLIFGRLLPGGVAAALVTSAISPIQPALQAFAVAANALTGDPNAGGVDMPEVEDLDLPLPGAVPNPDGVLSKLFGKKTAKTDRASREIAGLADQMKARAEQRAAENKAKMGPRDPPVPGEKAKKKARARPAETAKPPEDAPAASEDSAPAQ